MEAAIVLKDLKLVLRHEDVDDDDHDIRQHDLEEYSTQRLLSIFREQGFDSEQSQDEVRELAEELSISHGNQVLKAGEYWDIDYSISCSVDGLGISWRDL